jgi:hypothetical protein
MNPVLDYMESTGGSMISLDLMLEKPVMFDAFIDEVADHHADTQYGVIVNASSYNERNFQQAAVGKFIDNLRVQGKEPKILVVNHHSHLGDVYRFLKEAMSPPVVSQFETLTQPAFNPMFADQIMRRIQVINRNSDLISDMLNELFKQFGPEMKIDVSRRNPVPPAHAHDQGFGQPGGFFGSPLSLYDQQHGAGALRHARQQFSEMQQAGSRLPRGFGFTSAEGRKMTAAPAPMPFKPEGAAWDRKDEVLSSQRNHAVPSSRVHLIPASPEAYHELNTWSVTKRRTHAGIQQLARVTIHAVGMEGLNQIPLAGSDTRVVVVKASNAVAIDIEVANHFAELLAERDINAAIATMEQVDVMFEAQETGKSTKRDMVLVISTDSKILDSLEKWTFSNNGKLVHKTADVIWAPFPLSEADESLDFIETQLAFANWVIFTGDLLKDSVRLNALRAKLLKRCFENVMVAENPETEIENKYLFSN